jgi:uncharacterized protein
MTLEILGWLVVVALFAIGMAGAVYPILPGAIAIFVAFFAYGLFFSFEPFGVWFWIIQSAILVVLFIADYLVNAWGVKKFGGSRASVIGSTVGLIVGPFVIPAFGLIIGPLAGAVIGELMQGASIGSSLKAGWGALVGLFGGIVAKVVLQSAMILLFAVWLIFN